MISGFRLFISASDKQKPPPPAPLKIPKKHKNITFDDLLEILASAEKSAGLPNGLLPVLAFAESSGDPTAVSSDGQAMGLLQITPIFRQDQAVKDVTDIREVATKAARFLKHSYNLMSNSPNLQNFSGFGWDPKWELAVMAYHAGNQGVLNWLGKGAPLTGEHKNVGSKTLNYGEKIANYMDGGFNPEIMRPKWDKQAL